MWGHWFWWGGGGGFEKDCKMRGHPPMPLKTPLPPLQETLGELFPNAILSDDEDNEDFLQDAEQDIHNFTV